MKRAFTLVELLVSVGIFSLIMTLSAGAYLIMISINERAQGIALASDSLAFTLENMSRSMRAGNNYTCSATPGTHVNCSGGTVFTFTDAFGQSITYTFVPPAGGVNGYVRQTLGGVSYQITDPTISVTSLTFYLTGAPVGAADYTQPFVRMVITGVADIGHGNSFTFSVQTSATMREIDDL